MKARNEDEGRFNPLHCGAVVASRRNLLRQVSDDSVSIPFIAGQWSLLAAPRCASGMARQFQSPSLRGSGRFIRRLRFLSLHPLVSIPFIAGQWSLRVRRAHGARRSPHVSIPFIAGQWSLPAPSPVVRDGVHPVSIPFIAGQWSLPQREAADRARAQVSIPFIAGQWSLPVVHCLGGPNIPHVSIPFIAGQWSLPRHWVYPAAWRAVSQSPSLRGSGRFSPRLRRGEGATPVSQSPSLRGSGRFL